MNQLGNSKNVYQTGVKKVLTICSAGLLRSPTAATVLHEDYGFNCRAAGSVAEYALIPITEALVYWADELLFVSEENFSTFHNTWGEDGVAKAKIDEGAYQILDIPDCYEWGNEELKQFIRDQYDPLKVTI